MLRQKLMGGAGVEPAYIEDVMSTYLYTGNGSTQTINNGIDLAGEGGLVWLKGRTQDSSHGLYDTARGVNKLLQTDRTDAQFNGTSGITSFNADGWTIGSGETFLNNVFQTYVSWTFRKQPKFFDVVTYTGNGVAGRTIAHNLGSVPGCIIVKNLSQTSNWSVWHRSVYANDVNGFLRLDTTSAVLSSATQFAGAAPTSTVFTVGSGGEVNNSGIQYVAYLFAHNAGGFGLTGTDNVISCGSYAGSAGEVEVNLGYEPQWLLIKQVTGTGFWAQMDNMRGIVTGGTDPLLIPNEAIGEVTGNGNVVDLTSTGFKVVTTNNFTFNGAGQTYIYIAIRRGPMKVPTTGTSVFTPVAYSGNGVADRVLSTGSVLPDLAINMWRTSGSYPFWMDRLRGKDETIRSSDTSAGVNLGAVMTYFDVMTNLKLGYSGYENALGTNYVYEVFQRAPGFFDEICFSGTGANKTEAHNLQKAPELWLVKSRSATTEWVFGSSLLGANEKIVMPLLNGRVTDTTVWNNTYPTASVLSLGTSSTTNASGATFVAYLWGTVSGVSKVGTYTGNGSSQTIDCGFAGGARFVMIIRATASTAQDIYIWDSARGIVAGNDPRLSLNTTVAEVTTLDTIDTASSGFVVNTDASNVNVSGAVYLYLSIA